MMLIAITM